MYNVYLDGNLLLYSTAQTDTENTIINPTLNLEVNKSGFFSFTLPPTHALYDQIEKLKSVITVEQDSVELYRGRVMSDETDFFNQKYVNCEGELSYFLDSLQPPCEYDGTAMGLLQQMMDNHNNAVEEDKQFTLGTVTAIDETQTAQIDVAYYTDTWNMLNDKMLGAYGGYLRIRHADGKRYLDYLSETETNEQPIAFGVNLLELKKSVRANNMFTVLIPLGAAQQDKEGLPLDVSSVNNGLNYIEDAEAVAKYGRIWRTQTWNYIDDPEKLLAKGHEFLTTGITEETTFTIKAVDMHFVDPNTSMICVGDMVRIVSNPHGIDKTIICSKLDIDLQNPENTEYTFGVAPAALTDNALLAQKKLGGGGGGGGRTIEDEVKEWNTWADWFEEDSTAKFQITTGAINIMNGNSTGADIDLNGVVPMVKLSAHTQDIDTLNGRVDQTESSILVNAEGIKAKVDKNGVISAINLTSEAATIQANRINLEGYVTASELAALSAEITNLTAGYTTAGWIRAQNLDASIMADLAAMRLAGSAVNQKNITMGNITSAGKALATGDELDLSHSHAVIVSDDGTVTLGEVSATGGNFKIADTKAYKDGVSAARTAGANSVTLTVAGWVGSTNVVSASNGKSATVNLPDFSATGGTAFDSNHQTTVYFSTPSVNGPLKSVTVNASDVYREGYEAGWAAAVAMCAVAISGTYGNVITVKMPSSTVDTAAADDVFTISSGGYIDDIRNTAANTFSTQGRAYAYLKRNDDAREAVSTTILTESQTINVGQ